MWKLSVYPNWELNVNFSNQIPNRENNVNSFPIFGNKMGQTVTIWEIIGKCILSKFRVMGIILGEFTVYRIMHWNNLEHPFEKTVEINLKYIFFLISKSFNVCPENNISLKETGLVLHMANTILYCICHCEELIQFPFANAMTDAQGTVFLPCRP